MAEQAESVESGSPLNALRINGDFRFESESLFSDLDFSVEPGVWTCLLGSSGSGKSTLLRLIAGLETGGVFDGNITDADSTTVASETVKQSVSFMAQSDLLLPWLTVRQNVALGHRLRDDGIDQARVDDLIARVGLSNHAKKKPGQLSGGMRQRTALARTLMEDKPIVLLDEPFSALDSKTRSDMQALAFQVLKGKTVLLVTHDVTEAVLLGSQVFVLKNQSLESLQIDRADDADKPMRQISSAFVVEAQTRLLQIMNS